MRAGSTGTCGAGTQLTTFTWEKVPPVSDFTTVLTLMVRFVVSPLASKLQVPRAPSKSLV
jgi:hypothetical protein